MSTIFITGATGRLGRLIVNRLVERGQTVRAFTRRPEAAHALFPEQVEIASGAFSDRSSIDAALQGVDRLLLLSPISETLTWEQIAVAEAAAAAGVSRVVKISGSEWTIDPPGATISGDAHAAVEWHLRKLPIEHVSIRPNAWMQVGLAATIAQAQASNSLSTAKGDARVSYIDARDISDVAVHQLLAEKLAEKPLVITGGEAVSIRQIATLLAAHLRRPVGVNEVRSVAEPVLGESFEHRAVRQFKTLIAAGRAAPTTDTVAQLLGRQPRTVAEFIAEYFAEANRAEEKIA